MGGRQLWLFYLLLLWSVLLVQFHGEAWKIGVARVGSRKWLRSPRQEVLMRPTVVHRPSVGLFAVSSHTAAAITPLHKNPMAVDSTSRKPSSRPVNRRTRSQTAKRIGGGVDPVFLSNSKGRVSVYCVGANIDVEALRAHVFRKGFGRPPLPTQHANRSAESVQDLRLTRHSENALLDDEVLHVSNTPFSLICNSDDTSGSGNGLLDSRSTDDDCAESEQQKQQLQVQAFLSIQDVFYFEFGCVVFWGLSEREERAALTELIPFIIDPVNSEELDNSFDSLDFTLDLNRNSNSNSNNQRAIKFDLLTLRSLHVYEKLSLAFALAQSSKLFVFESQVLHSLERTRYLPKELALRGRISCSKKELNRLIGQLFVQQTEVNLFSSILDTPEFLWDNDEHLPSYQACRLYLEVNQRVSLLNTRLSVMRELLDVLTAQVADHNSTRLEWIVIWLIVLEIALSVATNPLFAGGKGMIAALAVPFGLALYKQLNDRQS